jgi:hypothetical protein
MKTANIPARDIKQGQQITAVPGEKLRCRKGVWPTVTAQSFLANGEGGKPTVYIETHEMPGWTYCFSPDEPVTVLMDDTRDAETAEAYHPPGDMPRPQAKGELQMQQARLIVAAVFFVVGALLILQMILGH